MKHRSLVVLSIVVLLATVVFSASLIAGNSDRHSRRSARGQPRPACRATQTAAAAGRNTARPGDGCKALRRSENCRWEPDLQGYWGNGTDTPLTRPQNVTKEFYTDAEFKTVLKHGASGEAEQTTPGTAADVHYDFTQFGLDTSQSPIPRNLRTSLDY